MSSIVCPGLYLFPKFSFSDGNTMNSVIHARLAGLRDVGFGSEEVTSVISDWTSLYHLSYSRAAVLEPIGDRIESPILEIGCGMGALTRALGERGHEVYSYDQSEARELIVRERCRDLPNVRVGLEAIGEKGSHFMTVLLVGVLEYAPAARNDVGPRAACLALLRRARSHLRRGGRLILAIENQLGAQYFNGAPEDHNGIPYFGLDGRYPGSGVVTFGRKELSSLLQEAGFCSQRWFYPFPDYKFPTCILSDAAVSPNSPLNPVPLIRRSDRLALLRRADPSFSLPAVWDLLWKNGVLPDFSNSFLIEAKVSDDADSDVESELAWVIPPIGCRSVCRGVDVISADAGLIAPRTRPPFPASQGDRESSWGVRSGHHWDRLTHADALVDALDGSGELEAGLSSWFAEWIAAINRLLGLGSETLCPEYIVPWNVIQAVPSNLVRIGQVACFVDISQCDRWLPGTARIDWLIYRGLLHTLLQARQSGAGWKSVRGWTVRDLMRRIGSDFVLLGNAERESQIRSSESVLLATSASHVQAIDFDSLESLRF